MFSMNWRQAGSPPTSAQDARDVVAENAPDAFLNAVKGHEAPFLLKPVPGLFRLAEWSGAVLGAARAPTYRLFDCSPIAHSGRKT